MVYTVYVTHLYCVEGIPQRIWGCLSLAHIAVDRTVASCPTNPIDES